MSEERKKLEVTVIKGTKDLYEFFIKITNDIEERLEKIEELLESKK